MTDTLPEKLPLATEQEFNDWLITRNDYQLQEFTFEDNIRIHQRDLVQPIYTQALDEIKRLEKENQAAYRASIGEVWYWQGDGDDKLESLICPILIEAEDFRNIYFQIASADKRGEEQRNLIIAQDKNIQTLIGSYEDKKAEVARLTEPAKTDAERAKVAGEIFKELESGKFVIAGGDESQSEYVTWHFVERLFSKYGLCEFNGKRS
jgi:hypothetical protein